MLRICVLGVLPRTLGEYFSPSDGPPGVRTCKTTKAPGYRSFASDDQVSPGSNKWRIKNSNFRDFISALSFLRTLILIIE